MFTILRHILEMIRFSHTLFALPFALSAAVMAWTAPVAVGPPVSFRGRHLAGLFVCLVCARSAAMAFNRIADRHFDRCNPRTMNRHLPSGVLSVASVGLFTALAAAGFVAGTLLFWPNPLPLVFAIPVLVFLLSYSFAKRFTTLTHFWLGTALMMAPLGAWVAIRGAQCLTWPLDALPALLVGLAVLLWVAGFDVIYACQDVEFDVRAHLRSIPARWGVVRALRMAAACHAGMVVTLVALPFLVPQLSLGWIYGSGIGAVAVLLIYEHALVRPNDLTRVNVAFFHVNAAVSIGLFLVTALDLLT
jgi:4-hydroxybenzoate polyprenyltransferase